MINSNIKIVQFENLLQCTDVRHAFTTKIGGVSEGVFATMNFGFNRGDSKVNVLKNYELLAEHLGLSVNDFILTDQIHEDTILRVSKNDRGNGIFFAQKFSGVDGFVTNEKDVVLTAFFADCVPLYFYDPVHQAIGISHAGWRGTVSKIGIRTVEKMKTEFGTEAKDLLVGIGPSIGACCYEVSEDVKKQFDLSFNDDIIASVVYPRNDKYLIDLWRANEMSLITCGVRKEHIEISKMCTQCNSSTFYSHRVMGNARGSQIGIIALV